jgi:hypothetical protein
MALHNDVSQHPVALDIKVYFSLLSTNRTSEKQQAYHKNIIHVAQKRNYTGFIIKIDYTPIAKAQKAQQIHKPTLMHLIMAEAGRNM